MYVVDYSAEPARRVRDLSALSCLLSDEACRAGARPRTERCQVGARQGARCLRAGRLAGNIAIDLARLGQALGADPGAVKLATADEIEGIFHDCEPGTIPPFGRLYELRTVADVSLQGAGLLVFRTNIRHLGIRMQFRDYESLEVPLWADFARSDQLRDQGSRLRGTGNDARGDPSRVLTAPCVFIFHLRTVLRPRRSPPEQNPCASCSR